MGPTRSPSEPVGLHLEVELKPQLKSHVGQKMAAMLMTQVRNGRGQKLMGLAKARSTNTESGRPRLHHHNVEVIASHRDTRERVQEPFLFHRV